MGFGPQVADLDGDGRDDVVSGSFPGAVYWFRRREDGAFAPGVALLAHWPGEASSVALTDWDGDGKLDLILGQIDGFVFFLPRERTIGDSPTFGSPWMLTSDGRPVRAPGGDAGPAVADWDGDGVQDLLLGSASGRVLWYRGKKRASLPELLAPVDLIPLGTGSAGAADRRREGRAPVAMSKPAVADWNGDGLPDLLVGDRVVVQEPALGLDDERLRRFASLEARYDDSLARIALARERATDEAWGRMKLPSPNAVDWKELRRRWTRSTSEILDEDAEYWATVDRSTGLHAELEPLRGPGRTTGFVWVYLRAGPAISSR